MLGWLVATICRHNPSLSRRWQAHDQVLILTIAANDHGAQHGTAYGAERFRRCAHGAVEVADGASECAPGGQCVRRPRREAYTRVAIEPPASYM
jgi:hypothetical protein